MARRSFGPKAQAAARLAASLILLASVLVGCAREEPKPVLSTWGEQFAAMEKAVGSGDFELVSAALHPLNNKPVSAGEPIELRGHFAFISPKSSGMSPEGKALYPIRMVRFNDHHLATSLMVAPDYSTTVWPPPPGSGKRARLIRISPQEALRQTRAEGEAHMGQPVDRGNISINLARADEAPAEAPEARPDVPPAWRIHYYGEKETLTFLIDAQTRATLKRTVEETKKDRPENTASPSPEP